MSTPQLSVSPLLCWAVLLGSGVAWGATQVFSKIAVSTGHQAMGLVVWQCVIGVVMLGAVMALHRQPLPFSRFHLAFYAACALLGTALPHGISYTAIAFIPAGIASILIATVPMMTLTMSAVMKLDRASPRRIAGLALGALAVVLVVGPEASLPEPGQAAWAAILLIVAVSYAAENVVIAKYQPADTGPVQTLMGLTLGALLMVLPLTAASGVWVDLAALGPAEQALIAASVLHVVAYLGLVWLIAQAGPIFAAQIGYIVTLSGVILGIVLLGESHAAFVWLALALMLAGVALVQPRGA